MNLPTTIAEAAEALAGRTISAVELTQAHIDRLTDADPKIQSVLTRLDERALERAAKIDRQRAAGEKLGPLAGIPFTAKDMFLVEGTRTTAASQILKDFVAPYTATAIAKVEAAGAILLAKVNQDEFAHGGSTEYSSFHPTKNPRDLAYVPGGSSGGSAAAVAAGIGLFSLGTDTGGSIRQPAAYCGVVGVKPTYGLVSRYGVVAMASSLDVIGPLANTVDDAALVLEVIAGQDEHDATTIALESYDFHRADKLGRIGVVQEYLEGLTDDVRARYDEMLGQLVAAGWRVEPVSLPQLVHALPTYYIVTPSEISSNLERYDGIRYGSRSTDPADLLATYRQTKGEFFGPEVQRRILTGTYALSAGYYDAYYKKAMQIRTLLRKDFARAFEGCDILIGPTTPAPAFKLGSNSSDPVQMYLADIMTVAANLAGIPAISIPVQGPSTLPLGLQIMAPQTGEASMFTAARAAEAALATKLEGITV